jgi:hypothetical protein
MNIKEFYLNTYPTDELGEKLNENTTFVGLLTTLYDGGDVYDYFGVGDSIIRERLFEELANQINKPYDYVYDLWMKDVDYTKNADITLNTK